MPTRIARAVAGSGLVAGVAPVISESVALQDLTTRQTEPRVTLFASDPARLRPFGDIRAGGETVSLAELRPGELYLNADGAAALHAAAGDTVRVYAGNSVLTARVRAVVRYDGGATDGSGILMPLAAAQQLLGKPGLVRGIFVANAGGVGQSDRVVALLKPTLAPLGLEADTTKQDALEAADSAGATFMAMFTTFGSFSIAAGILLIFLIFVMLAAERRGELGIARAVGTRRGHLVQLFLYEGVAYDLIAAAVGALIGVAVAYGMVIAMASAFASTSDLAIGYDVRTTSVVLAYSLGVLLTLAVVAFSAWRVSRMNIVAAIRNLPDAPVHRARHRRTGARRRRRRGGPAARLERRAREGLRAARPRGLARDPLGWSRSPGSSGRPDRVVHTAAGLALIVWFVFPFSRWLFGEMKVNFSIFVLGGLMIVIGATWTIIYNADVLLGVVGGIGGRVKSLAPVLRMAIAYPLRSLFRTGVTLAMFTLVVFTLVVGATTSGSFIHAFNDIGAFGGGFDVRATTSPAAPILDMRAAVDRAPGHEALGLPRRLEPLDPAGQGPAGRRAERRGVVPRERRRRGVSRQHDVRPRGSRDRLCDRPQRSGAPSATAPTSPWSTSSPSPRRANWGTRAIAKFHLTGFYLEDKTFAPVARPRARSADRQAADADRDRRPLGQRARC